VLHPVRLAEFSVNFSYSADSSLGRVPACHAGGRVRFLHDAVQSLAFGEKYWDLMYTLRPSTSSQPSS
jgi:hypothetical protein